MNDYKALAKEFTLLKDDVERWKWIVKHQDVGITVYCDNGDTYAHFDEEYNKYEQDYNFEMQLLQFDWVIGWEEGVFNLLEAVGIKAESV